MCKLILIAVMSLLASQACAGGSRSLSLAASPPNQQATEQPAAAQPATTQTATTTPAATASAASSPAATKPKRRQPSTEARVIRELHHRHGIYW
ncbi:MULTISPECIES: hypothetical protein [Bradyrhizobium]|uniref:hypothetical protein n=1 Tax=Bradyrhizobium TaxID=374 RepID=UPI00293EF93F|nr:hypothetical protein [Bradyrhizobium sp. NDS-1]WOH73332.1 hypothetical protein RX330_34585 [Bradyrhizobium sp. NDS-1]